MRTFVSLLDELERTPDRAAAVARLVVYFRHQSAADAAWAVRWLTGIRSGRLLRGADLRTWAAETAGLPPWLFAACEAATDDLAEAAALVLPEPTQPSPSLTQLGSAVLEPLAHPAATDATRARLVRDAWTMLSIGERVRFHKLVTGTWRPPVPREWLAEALGQLAGLAPAVILRRLTGAVEATPDGYARLLATAEVHEPTAPPMPFRATRVLEVDPSSLGEVQDWEFRWTREGARLQVVRGPDDVAVWSERGALVTTDFAAIARAAAALPAGTVLEGEVAACAVANGEIARVFFAHDLRAEPGQDLGSMSPLARRARLESLIAAATQAHPASGSPGAAPGDRAGNEAGPSQGELFSSAPRPVAAAVARDVPPSPLRVAPLIPARSWSELATWQQRARVEGSHGIRLRSSQTSNTASASTEMPDWIWLAPPWICEAVLVSVRPPAGRAARGPAEFTLAVRHGTRFATVARLEAALPAAEWTELETWIAAHTTQRFGPVRAVEPALVFELASDGLAPAPRTQAGVRLERPRLLRWRRDRTADVIPTLADWTALVRGTSPGPEAGPATNQTSPSPDSGPA